MIVVRDVFRLKFGQAKEATELWKRAVGLLQNSGYGVKATRLLTDIAGPAYYTIVLESSFDSLADWEKAAQAAKSNTQWHEVYQRIIALTEEGRREILSVIA
jgi:hypothetical protein